MALIRLLQRKPDGEIVFRESTSSDVPAYAILSHTWGKEEVSFQDMEASAGMGKAGWKKIEFCAKQAAADGLEYFWIDTCCIDKKNAVELSAAINSMFRWYQNATRCYAFLGDVSTPDARGHEQRVWEEAFRKSRWFTRGWTLQELIAPSLVEFFSLEGERLGNKLTLGPMVHEITCIASSALRGDALSNFSINERMSWAEHRNTTVEEDEIYCLIGIFDVSMLANYGEGRDKASRRLQEEIHKFYKGTDFEQFAIELNLSTIPEAAQFVARQTELTEMYRLLHGHKTQSVVVLHGLGGIGKTQLAIEYVRRHKEKYTAIFWLNANDEDSLRLSFRRVAQQVLKHHPSTGMPLNVDLEGDLDQVVNAVKVWLDLRKNSHWLMIYDNYDNPRTPNNSDRLAVDVRQYLPEADHGSIIITTRSANVTQGQRLHVQKLLDVREGLNILSNMSGRTGIENDPDAKALVAKLDGLPLALSTAGAYLEHVTMSFAEYLRLYEMSWLKLQTTSPRLSSYEDRSLYTTWQITFDRIRQQNAVSARLLELWAYFDRQDVWFELLRHGRSTDDERIRTLTGDKLNFNEAVRLLCEYGLVHMELSPPQQSGSARYGVHSCVHSWTIYVLNEEWDEGLARLALACVASEVPNTNVDKWWLLQQRLLQHAARYEHLIADGKVDVEGMAWALHNLGLLYKNQGKLVEAEAMYTRALQGSEEALGPKHTSTLSKLAEAEAMYTRALQGSEEALGPKHTSTLSTVNNLGMLYADQGKLAEAEAMYTQALQGKEEALGPKHTSTLGKLAEAEAMYTRALQGYENALGPESLRLYLPALNTMFAFGDLLSQTSRKDMAKEIYSRALSGYTTVQGPSSKWCRQLEDRLQALQVASIESEAGRDGFTEIRAPKSRSLRQTLRKLGRRLNVE
ncbi:hypothetical protein DL95DRAFT_437398 [Leptodontidium sp. 2 PMI_412]|nr:hypothetical protein DL95DRAFT_437398 [Leptodontidium sp. 2 PMI_412]